MVVGRALLLATLIWVSAIPFWPGAVAGALWQADAPPIAPFRTARVRIEGTISAQGQELPIQGEGDIDAARGASRLTLGLLGATFETITVDGRLYSRTAGGRWQYTEGAGAQGGGFNPARLAPYDPDTIRAAGRNWVRVGSEEVDGVATTHWRADADVPTLLGTGVSGPGAGFGVTTATMDLWLGDADGRLRRLRVDGRGNAPDGSGAPGVSAQSLTLTFGAFDAPVEIAPPPDAVPAPPPVPAVGSPVPAAPTRGTVAPPAAGATLPAATVPPAAVRATTTTAPATAPTAEADRSSSGAVALPALAVIGGALVLAAVGAGLVVARRRSVGRGAA